ncbi:MAG: hypothetical protein EOO71_32930 [Myxococcaceae bacterium]|nr:MAG: hypothetical protein EOO71_32930 [Myxococcaceae bacterium]
MSGIQSLGALSRRAFATLVAAFALAFITLAPGDAHAYDESLRVSYIRVKIGTGGDDLRNASLAVAQLKYLSLTGSQQTASGNLNNYVGWGNYTENTVTYAVPGDVYVDRLLEFAIQFTSGQPNIFSTGDNWNMNSITVTAILSNSTETILLTMAGNPLHRFQSDNFTRWAVTF